MLEQKDLQAIAELMRQQKKEIVEEMRGYIDNRFEQQKEYIDDRFEQQIEYIDDRFEQQKEYIDEKNHESEGRMLALIEADIDPKLAALAEGHRTLLETLASKSHVEALEGNVAIMKQVIRAHSSEIEELKKAQ